MLEFRPGKSQPEKVFSMAVCWALKPWVTLAAAEPHATSPGQHLDTNSKRV